MSPCMRMQTCLAHEQGNLHCLTHTKAAAAAELAALGSGGAICLLKTKSLVLLQTRQPPLRLRTTTATGSPTRHSWSAAALQGSPVALAVCRVLRWLHAACRHTPARSAGVAWRLLPPSGHALGRRGRQAAALVEHLFGDPPLGLCMQRCAQLGHTRRCRGGR